MESDFFFVFWGSFSSQFRLKLPEKMISSNAEHCEQSNRLKCLLKFLRGVLSVESPRTAISLKFSDSYLLWLAFRYAMNIKSIQRVSMSFHLISLFIYSDRYLFRFQTKRILIDKLGVFEKKNWFFIKIQSNETEIQSLRRKKKVNFRSEVMFIFFIYASIHRSNQI